MLFKKKKPQHPWHKIFIVVMSVFLVAFIGGLFTDIGPWYAALPKPSFQPPNWLFGPVWFTLYVLTGWSALLVWTTPKANQDNKNLALFTFATNGVLNILWSFLFFTLKDVSKAFTEITILWASIVLMIYLSSKVNKRAAWLLVPYLAWVSFASFLNYSILAGTSI